jgi:protein involved in polysaccharide export with SLBB domain
MKATRNPRRVRRTAACAFHLALGLAGLVLWTLPGCSENRISLEQFLRDHPQATGPARTGTATTRPVATQPAAGPSIAADQYWTPYRVGPGDVLALILTGIEQTGVIAPIQARVDREGNIDLPLAGPVHVEALELQDVEKAVQKAYVPSVYRQLSVHVELAKPEMVTVLVTGAVSTPGLVQLPRTQRNLLYAIAGAGGVSNLASGEVTLRRLRDPQETRFSLLEPEQLQQALTMDPLQNGDAVLVQAAQPNAVFIGGLVMAPHVQVNPPGTQMNVLQAIASAGGLRSDLTPLEMTLIRRTPDGKDVHVKLDVDRIQKGKDPNFNLAPGDILWVPETLLTRAEDWANKNLYFRGGFNVVGTYSVNGVGYMNDQAKQAAIGNTNNVQNTVDPLGFLTRQQQLTNITNQLPAPQ